MERQPVWTFPPASTLRFKYEDMCYNIKVRMMYRASEISISGGGSFMWRIYGPASPVHEKSNLQCLADEWQILALIKKMEDRICRLQT